MNDHEHKYYLSGKTYTEFLPAIVTLNGSDPDTDVIDRWLDRAEVNLYERTEYAILSCNCGDVIRKVVKDD